MQTCQGLVVVVRGVRVGWRLGAQLLYCVPPAKSAFLGLPWMVRCGAGTAVPSARLDFSLRWAEGDPQTSSGENPG